MPEPRIITYTLDSNDERNSLRHLAMLHVDRVTENGTLTTDVVMPFYGTSAEEARSAAARWLRTEREAVATKRANLEAGAAKRAEARKAKAL